MRTGDFGIKLVLFSLGWSILVVVTAGILIGCTGNGTEEPWQFDRHWGQAERLHYPGLDVQYPKAGIDDQGNAIAVWSDYLGYTPNEPRIMANRYDAAGGGWATHGELIDTVRGEASFPNLAVDGTGNAIAVWHKEATTSGHDEAWSARYTLGIGWSDPELLNDPNALEGRYPNVALNHQGDGLAAWEERDASGFHVMAKFYSHETGWFTPEKIGEGETVFGCKIVTNSEKNSLVLWRRYESDVIEPIYSAHYSPENGWESAIQVTTAGVYMDIQASMNSSGNALMTTAHQIFRYIKDSGWLSDGPFTNNASVSVQFSSLDFNDVGHGVLVWEERLNQEVHYYLVIKRFDGTRWSENSLAYNGDPIYRPSVCMDPNGTIVIIWNQFISESHSSNIRCRRFYEDNGWAPIEEIGMGTAADGGIGVTFLSMNVFGEAVAMWNQDTSMTGYQPYANILK